MRSVTTAVLSVWCLMLGLGAVAQAQTPVSGSVEIAPFTGGMFTSTTFEDPAVPGQGITIKSTLLGADIAYYPRPHFGAGLVLIRQHVSVGPASQRAALSATVAGGLIKYRLSIGQRTGFAIVGGGGVTRSRIEAVDPSSGSAGHASGTAALAGASVSFAMTRHACFDLGVRGVFNRFRIGGDRAARHVGGMMMTFGIDLWAP